MSPCSTYLMEMLIFINSTAPGKTLTDRQASALGGGKMNNIQGKNSCVYHFLALSPPVWKIVADLQLDQLRGLYTYPKSSCIRG